MLIVVGKKKFRASQIEKCMVALATATCYPVYLKAISVKNKHMWCAIIGGKPISNASDSAWKALCGVVNQWSSIIPNGGENFFAQIYIENG